jgi:hypothetical protein
MMLEKIADRLWLTEEEIVNFHGFPYPTRSVIARFDNGELWVWSPVRLAGALKPQVDGLGRVAHLVSPNKIHHLYLADWKEAYPHAQLWGPQSTISRHPELIFQAPLQDTAPVAWQSDIDQAWFQGSFAMDEVVFYHRPSRTVSLPTSSRPSAISSCASTGHGGSALLPRSMALSPTRRWRRSSGGCRSCTGRRRAPPAPRSSVGPANRSSWRTGSGSAQAVTLTWSSRWPGLALKGEGNRRPSYAGGGPNTSTALRPPNAKEFDMA